jgi:hypothetical protein
MLDITSLFLEPPVSQVAPLQKSSLFVYRGIIRKLQGTTSFYAGLLGGANSAVLDVILVETFEALKGSMECPELRKRWVEKGYDLLGLAFWGDRLPEEYTHDLETLGLRGADTFLLQISSVNGYPQGWEVQLGSELELDAAKAAEFTPVEVCSDGRNRKKGEEYIVVPLHHVGVTMKDHMRFLATQAARSHAAMVVVETQAALEKALKAPFRRYKCPPDGKCCWHSIAAALQIDKYIKIPRQESGYAVNVNQQKAEESSSRKLMQLALSSEQAKESSIVARTGTVDLVDLHWVGRALGLSIRCTVQPEAGVFLSKTRKGCIYIYCISNIAYV